MSEFLTTKGISFMLDQIIKKSENQLYILTAYLRLSPTIYESILDATKRGVNVHIIYGKTEITLEQEKLLQELKCNVYFKENLHGKCYANEKMALISTMNLHSYSEVNNREFGVLIEKRVDTAAYNDCISEINSILNQSNNKIIVEKSSQVEYVFNREEFLSAWYEFLLEEYTEINFLIENSNGNRRIFAKNFPINGVDFSDTYGFMTFEIKNNKRKFDLFRDREIDRITNLFSEYRFFWNSDHKIMVYHAKNKIFSNLIDEVSYCSNALSLLIKEFKEVF